MKETCSGNKRIKCKQIHFCCAKSKDGQQAPDRMTGRKLQSRFSGSSVACNEMSPGIEEGKSVNQSTLWESMEYHCKEHH